MERDAMADQLHFIERALHLERLAEDESNVRLRGKLAAQAVAYRRLATAQIERLVAEASPYRSET